MSVASACQKSQWLFCTLQIRHIFCEAYASRKISLRSSKSLMAQAFLMAIIQLEAGLAPSSSPAARLYLLSNIGFLTVSNGGYEMYPSFFAFYTIFSVENSLSSTERPARLRMFTVHMLIPARPYSRTSASRARTLRASSNHTSCRTPAGSV